MWTVVILVFLATAIFDLVLRFLAYKNQGLPAPANLRDIYDSETYAKRSAYGKERLRLFIVADACSALVTLALLLSNFHSVLFYFIGRHTPNMYLQALFMLGVVLVISQAVKTAFAAVLTFKVEAKYGFNKSSARTFVSDRIRDFLIVHVGLFLGAIMLFLFLHGLLGNAVFVAFVFVFALYEIVFMFLGIFMMGGKRKPLEDGALKEKIEALLAKAGFPIDRIFVRDDSKRHSKISASCAGLGKTRTIVLGDNLLDGRYSDDEVLNVVAHELEHAKAYQDLRLVPLRFAAWIALVFMAYFVVNSGAISAAFGFTELNVAFGVYVALMVFCVPVMHLTWIPVNAMYRSNELAADRFGARMAGKEAAISGLKKGARDNFENLTPHWLNVMMSATHPPMAKRIENIEKNV